MLLGATTYEQIVSWDIPFPYAGKDCYVFTSRRGLPAAGDNVTLVHEDPAEFVGTLRRSEGGPVWLVGGGWLFVRLWDAGLVDEIDLFVQPIVLGDGVPLFPAAHEQRALSLLDTQGFASGVVRLRYAVRSV